MAAVASPGRIERQAAFRALDDACLRQAGPAELIESVAKLLDQALGVDAVFLSATDPETLLPIGAGYANSLPQTICNPFWDQEFQVPDVHKFADFANGPASAGDLHTATGGRPETSSRWRAFRSFADLDGELRAAFKAGGRTWGLLHANRVSGAGGFAPDEVSFVEQISGRIGLALRRAALAPAKDAPSSHGPGMVLFDRDQRIRSLTDEAVGWFEQIRSYDEQVATGWDVRLPAEVVHLSQVARARGLRGDHHAVRTRLRTGDGRWLTLHASCLTDARGAFRDTAVVVDQADGVDIAPLLLEAYELTPRELQVAQALPRGLQTAEIAAELGISRHTVGDYLKRVYAKLGVTSRGEACAKLYFEHFNPEMTVVHG